MGKIVQEIHCNSSQYVIAWHPSKYIMVFTGDDKYIKGDKCIPCTILPILILQMCIMGCSETVAR
jgi:hypothetical protein